MFNVNKGATHSVELNNILSTEETIPVEEVFTLKPTPESVRPAGSLFIVLNWNFFDRKSMFAKL